MIEMKRCWRCNVCNDIHYGIACPEVCPTCMQNNSYCEVSEKEARNMMGAEGGSGMDAAAVLSAWEKFAEKNGFMLNPDKEHVDLITKGVLMNESKFGLKLCPCRLRDGKRERDLKITCPCNFRADENWKEKGMCWCGLFVKKK
ncbi:hypothetical protein JW898_00960 [Candidatus Woesearchaeota archaeon]|nr:hypothetical protein [Candidatus Woesearchaeota archaeon]